jgi:hypothetical protein
MMTKLKSFISCFEKGYLISATDREYTEEKFCKTSYDYGIVNGYPEECIMYFYCVRKFTKYFSDVRIKWKGQRATFKIPANIIEKIQGEPSLIDSLFLYAFNEFSRDKKDSKFKRCKKYSARYKNH